MLQQPSDSDSELWQQAVLNSSPDPVEIDLEVVVNQARSMKCSFPGFVFGDALKAIANAFKVGAALAHSPTASSATSPVPYRRRCATSTITAGSSWPSTP